MLKVKFIIDRDRALNLNVHRKEQSLQKHNRFLYSEKVII